MTIKHLSLSYKSKLLNNKNLVLQLICITLYNQQQKYLFIFTLISQIFYKNNKQSVKKQSNQTNLQKQQQDKFKKFDIPSNFIHGRDTRLALQIQKENEEIRILCQQNEAQFKQIIDQEHNKQINKFQNEVKELKLSGNRYLFYTDRISDINQNEANQINIPVIMTIHGIPGSLQDFLSLQQHIQARLSCRWINFSIPGLDGQDERRGTYLGYLEDTSLLMKDFLDELKIDKVVLIMHSAGGMYGKKFIHTHPERVKAIVQLASIGLEIWEPLLVQNTIFQKIGIDLNSITREQIDNKDFRDSMIRNINNLMNIFNQSKDKSLQVWKAMNFYHHIMLLKAQTYKNGFDSFFLEMKNLDRRIPRFFAYSQVDALLRERHLQQEIYYYILSPQSYNFQLKNQPKLDYKFQLRDEQSVLKNFIFSYNDAGHAFQYHKGFELSIKLKIFIQIIEQIEVSNKQINSQVQPKL
ncbi:alpha/beta fold hydrolase (macronuclear) [Tetrahymena thermophila SB210]|uniref:Alpha/beta fold hydrolase n=1 Tax=Tetrahymena thermophila (strain SB210) TaxID=312017 RepID=Q23ML8_TETTS|nr:alpha/beta fold hydrolase [Tetrahymena thermophila SB210]EAR97748.2 alpha/beta fold hydrolase [Tetrahymena thermophila SB210]|eukprot:XP_001017993.2 alpha/beta fold hydrolase [Tetrahymena thermophila SB210]